MKKRIIWVLLFISICSYAHNYTAVRASSIGKVTNIKRVNVPDAVLASFNSMFPNASSVRWEILSGSYGQHTQYFAQFRLNGQKRTARFAPDGTYIGGT